MTEPYRFFDCAVSATTKLSPGFIRITLTGPDLDRCADNGYDQRVKLVLPLPDRGYDDMPTGTDWFQQWRSRPDERRNPLRTYTLRAVRPGDREVDIDFAVHGDEGPATRWAAAATPGQPCLILAPDADFTGGYGGAEFPSIAPTTTVLLAGDETAVPAICAILERLDEKTRGHALLEVPLPEDVHPVTAPPGVEVTWLPRRGAPHGARLTPALSQCISTLDIATRPASATRDDDRETDPDDNIDDELWDTPALTVGDAYVWLAGEAGVMRSLRRVLRRDTGLPRTSMSVMGYWRRGKAEHNE